MASVSGNGARGHHKFTLNVNETGTNTANNTSTVSWSFVLSPIQSGWDWNISGISYSINVDGNVKNGTIQSYNGSSTITISSGTKTITHNDNGTKSIGFSFSVTDSAGKTYTPGNASGSGTLTLTTIPRASQPSINTWPNNTPSFNLGDVITIHMNKKSNSFRHNVYFLYGSNTYTVATNVVDNCTFDTSIVENDIETLIPNSNSYSNVVKVDTYNGSTLIGSKTCNYTANIVNANPIFEDFTYQDTNSDVVQITGSNQIIVKGLSTPQVNVSVANKMITQKSATPVKYVATIDTLNGMVDYSENNNVSIDLPAINNAGTKRLSVRAYDSRNNSTEVYKDIIVYDYAKPTVNATAERVNNFEQETILKIDGTYSPLNINNLDKNTIASVQYRYREKEGTWEQWANGTFTTNNGNYTVNDITLVLDSGKEFDVEIKVTDNFDNTVISRSVDVGQSIFFISSNMKKCYVNGLEVTVETEYSTTEEINTLQKWIDGEYIYSKVFEYSVTANSWNTFVLPSDINYSNIWIDMANSFNKYGSSAAVDSTSAPINWYAGTTDFGLTYINANSEIIIRNNSNYVRKYFITLKYTKN